MNELIRSIHDAHIASYVYYGFHVLGFLGVFLFNMYYGRHYGLSKSKAVLASLIVYPLTYAWMLLLYWIEQGAFGGQNIVRVFIYVPLIALLPARLFHVRWAHMCDFLAPSPLIVHGISHLGCIFQGCCHGYAYSSPMAVYNPDLGTYLRPIQPLESAAALAIVFWIVLRARRLNYKTECTSFPLMLLAFGLTRFFQEFARDNEKVFLGCSILAFHALLAAVVGAAWLIVLRRRKKTAVGPSL